MVSIQFDHFLTHASAANLEEYLREYAEQGFTPNDRTVRHEPGLRNGFVFFGLEYIEFCWVEDENLFAAADEEQRSFRTASRPFGMGLIAQDVHAVHDDWTARGHPVPDVWSKAPRDAAPDAPPVWSFQDVPPGLLPGVSAFVLTYHRRKRDDIRKVIIHPNTTYALSGVTFVSPEPESRAWQWRNVLAPDEQVISSTTGFDVQIGPHRASWMSPDAYHATFERQWEPAPHPHGELAVLHLLAIDLQTVKGMLESAGRQVRNISINGREELFVEPDPRDGFAFAVREQPVETWLQERMDQTEEKIEVEGA